MSTNTDGQYSNIPGLIDGWLAQVKTQIMSDTDIRTEGSPQFNFLSHQLADRSELHLRKPEDPRIHSQMDG
jgi:hypothetical protein